MKTPLKISIIDDDKICNFITTRLIRRSIEVETNIQEFVDSKDLLESLSQDNIPDIFFVDINLLREENGFDLIETIRLNYNTSNSLFVILTSSSHERDILRSQQVVVDYYVVKPLTSEKVKEVFETFKIKNYATNI